jgi:hypothetical protein
MNKHKEIEFGFGNLESAVNELAKYKEQGELVFGVFNGQKLYSDVDDIDSAYMKVVGKTKSEADAAEKKWHEEYEEKKRKHREAIPQLTTEWIEKGKLVLDEKYHETWNKCVPIRLGDLYEGMELGDTLEIIKELNAGCKLEVAKEIIAGQGHSGMSYSLVCAMVKSFCDRGEDFASFARL